MLSRDCRLDEAKKWRGQDREVINKLNQQITDLEAEVRSLRRSNDSLETERLRDKGVISRLHNEIEKLRAVAFVFLKSSYLVSILISSNGCDLVF